MVGTLAAVYEVERDTQNWEVHPAGVELILLLSGAIDLVFEVAGCDRVVELRQGGSCSVPRYVSRRSNGGSFRQ